MSQVSDGDDDDCPEVADELGESLAEVVRRSEVRCAEEPLLAIAECGKQVRPSRAYRDDSPLRLISSSHHLGRGNTADNLCKR